MAYSFGSRSQKNLIGVHPDLVKVAKLAIKLTDVDFMVTEGVRTKSRQKILFDSGASRTMNSRHITGHAIDVAAWIAGGIRWDWPLYKIIATAMKTAADQLDIPIVWGGDWKSFKDGPHFELDRRFYK